MSVTENIKERRSVRNYTKKEMGDARIKELIKLGTYAPSGVNRQPWKFIVITNKEKMKEISDRAKPLVVDSLPDSDEKSIQYLKNKFSDPELNIFYDAPCLVIVLGNKEIQGMREDCSMCAQTMMLAARGMGIGSCWIGALRMLAEEEEFRNEIGVPEGYAIVAPLIFGYPEEWPHFPGRDEPEIVNWIR